MSDVNLLFVRHGKTDYNSNKVIQGQADRSNNPKIKDLPLNSIGQKEAENVLPILESYMKPDIIFSSPLLRAYQTGEYISKHFDIELIKEERLRELFFGAKWEGVPVEEFKKVKFNPPFTFQTIDGETIEVKDGEELRKFHKSTDAKFDNLSHPDGEQKKDVVIRVKEAVEEFTSNNPQYKTICIPTHNALMRFLMSTINREEAAIKVEHTEIVHIIYNTETKEYSLYKRIKPVE